MLRSIGSSSNKISTLFTEVRSHFPLLVGRMNGRSYLFCYLVRSFTKNWYVHCAMNWLFVGIEWMFWFVSNRKYNQSGRTVIGFLPSLVTQSFLMRRRAWLFLVQPDILFVRMFFPVRKSADRWKLASYASSCRLCRNRGVARGWLTLQKIIQIFPWLLQYFRMWFWFENGFRRIYL